MPHHSLIPPLSYPPFFYLGQGIGFLLIGYQAVLDWRKATGDRLARTRFLLALRINGSLIVTVADFLIFIHPGLAATSLGTTLVVGIAMALVPDLIQRIASKRNASANATRQKPVAVPTCPSASERIRWQSNREPNELQVSAKR